MKTREVRLMITKVVAPLAIGLLYLVLSDLIIYLCLIAWALAAIYDKW